MRHDVPATTAAKAIGMTIPPTPSTVCWKPIAAPLRCGPAASAAAVNERPFQLMPRMPGDDEHGDEDDDRAVDECSGGCERDGERSARAG